MGNYVGYMPHNGINHYLNPELNPSPFEEPTFDPNIGFENGRKERGTYVYITELVYIINDAI